MNYFDDFVRDAVLSRGITLFFLPLFWCLVRVGSTGQFSFGVCFGQTKRRDFVQFNLFDGCVCGAVLRRGITYVIFLFFKNWSFSESIKIIIPFSKLFRFVMWLLVRF